ncbi:hypothetical protein MTR_0131s0030 [Medicago truncatula]|uniref:TF-B3 domain-containing protein n=1 Tax=Medicago truncatula TaxID=3880 RepID=A0A072THC8_MEDTR|nr:hypothetical protein MTR_0131s0030 [Medicago truncatula]
MAIPSSLVGKTWPKPWVFYLVEPLGEYVVDCAEYLRILPPSGSEEESVGENGIEVVRDERGYYHFEKKVTKAMSRASILQTLQFPKEIANLLRSDQSTMIMYDYERFRKYECTIMTFGNDKFLGHGWSKYVADNNVEEGDKLCFLLENPETLHCQHNYSA